MSSFVCDNHVILAIAILPVLMLWYDLPRCHGWIPRTLWRQPCPPLTTPSKWALLSSASASSATPTTSTTINTTNTAQQTQRLIAQAIQLSNLSPSNITAAEEATYLWKEILDNDDDHNDHNDSHDSASTPNRNRNNSLPDTIRGLCLTLYGTCLVRIGKDEAALSIFARVLEINDKAWEKSETAKESALLGRAASFQRLLRYPEALETYQEFLSSRIGKDTLTTMQKNNRKMAVFGALTCAMRLGRLTQACQIVDEVHETMSELWVENSPPPLAQTKAILQILRNPTTQLSIASVGQSEILDWIVLKQQQQVDGKLCLPNLALQSMVEFNVGPFDDPCLWHLDDKVLLHQLLTQENNGTMSLTRTFWPLGFVLPQQRQQLIKESASLDPNSRWMRKERAGYGSHGNDICTTTEALAETETNNTTKTEPPREFLLQRLIQPLLLRNRMFSLRIYVVYTITKEHEARVSRRGLVKLAALPYSPGIESSCNDNGWNDRRRIMTNSGREMETEQMELDDLLVYFEKENFTSLSPTILRQQIEHAVQIVMKLYRDQVELDCQANPTLAETRQKLARLQFPKILGFDFVVDLDARPWLIEVNRFPGMEARNAHDACVKEQVLRNAWGLEVLK